MSSPLPSCFAADCGARRASQPRWRWAACTGSSGTLAGDEWRPLEAHLAYPPPRRQRYYRSFFGCPIVFNSEIDAILISARDLERPIPSAQPLIARYLQKRVEAIGERPRRWDEQVSEVVRSLFATGDCSVERVAEHFACNRRTIHRHLAECGTTFSEILDTERADLRCG